MLISYFTPVWLYLYDYIYMISIESHRISVFSDVICLFSQFAECVPCPKHFPRLLRSSWSCRGNRSVSTWWRWDVRMALCQQRQQGCVGLRTQRSQWPTGPWKMWPWPFPPTSSTNPYPISTLFFPFPPTPHAFFRFPCSCLSWDLCTLSSSARNPSPAHHHMVLPSHCHLSFSDIFSESSCTIHWPVALNCLHPCIFIISFLGILSL